MTAWTNEAMRALVEPGRVHRRVYTDPEIFALEMERVFGRVWLYVAHESQLRQAGDFLMSRVGPHEVLVTRERDGALHVLMNACAHRGARVCAAERGRARNFVCPYHGWTYRLDGSLAALPEREGYGAGFSLDDPANHLRRAPRVASYRGFVFASLAADGPSLEHYLGPMTAAFDNLIERAPEGEIEVAGGGFRLAYPGNWKFHNENANDTFHPGFVHESSVATARKFENAPFPLDGGQSRDMLLANGFGRAEWRGVELTASALGHSYMAGFYKRGLLSPERTDPVTEDYRARMVAAYGAARAEAILGLDRFNNLVYPNLSVNAQYHQLRIVHPVAPDRTVMAGLCFRLKGAPDGIFERAVRFLSTLGSPASMIFADDVEIFGLCQKGLADGAREWINVARGATTDREGADGLSAGAASELPIRAQYRAWLAHMTAAA